VCHWRRQCLPLHFWESGNQNGRDFSFRTRYCQNAVSCAFAEVGADTGFRPVFAVSQQLLSPSDLTSKNRIIIVQIAALPAEHGGSFLGGFDGYQAKPPRPAAVSAS
jgi:hypothetical protein